MSDANAAHRFALGVETPRFTWAPQHSDANQQHAAHQIVVSLKHAQHGLAARSPVWDSGRVESHVPEDVYAGPSLKVNRIISDLCINNFCDIRMAIIPCANVNSTSQCPCVHDLMPLISQ